MTIVRQVDMPLSIKIPRPHFAVTLAPIRRVSRLIGKLERYPYPVYIRHVHFIQRDNEPRFLVYVLHNVLLFEIHFNPPITDGLITFAFWLLRHYYPVFKVDSKFSVLGLPTHEDLLRGDHTPRIVHFS